MSEQIEFDYIVVGAGTAGCALAARLAEKTHSVALIEQGPPGEHETITDGRAAQMFRLWEDRRFCRPFSMERAADQDDWPETLRGQTVGGSGAINALIHLRGNVADFDHWRDLGNPGWGFDDVRPLFRKLEHWEDGASAHRGGSDGLIKVRRGGKSDYAKAFEQAGMELGFYGPDWDFNCGQQQGGVGPYQFAVDERRQRSSTASTYLKLPAAEGNLHVMTNRQVLRLSLKSVAGRTGATGVVLLDRETMREAKLAARHEVILTAGAYESPKLLMLSGIGPAADLQAIGIAPQVDLPGVGQNLQDHIVSSLIFQGTCPLPAVDFVSEIGLFVDVKPGRILAYDKDGWPTVQFYMNAGLPERRLAGFPERFLGIYPALCRPKSRGSVRLASADPRRDPVIDPNYYADASDREIMVNALRLARKIAQTRPISSMIAGPVMAPAAFSALQPESVEEFDALEGYARLASRGIWHPAGSCRMGPAGEVGTVVDPELQVDGVAGLRVADASIMPTLTCGNPNATVIMIAEKAAEMILSDRRET